MLGDPSPLVAALRKLEIAADRVPLAANQATAHMFIVSPLRGGGVARLFSTHPSMDERIERLQGMIGGLV